MTDWHAWHEQYADPSSSLSRRLHVVQDLLRRLLRDLDERHRILSLCAGDGRDVIPVLHERPSEQRPDLVLVELDSELAAAGRRHATDAGVRATVIVGDAGVCATWQRHVPVHLLMLCGIFGNVTDQDIHATITATPSLLAPHGVVLWTRGAFGERDLRPQVRRWFGEAGFEELAYDAEPAGYGVGAHRAATTAPPPGLPARLFSFVR